MNAGEGFLVGNSGWTPDCFTTYIAPFFLDSSASILKYARALSILQRCSSASRIDVPHTRRSYQASMVQFQSQLDS